MDDKYGSVNYPTEMTVKVERLNMPDIQPHWHADVEILYVCEGAVKVQIDEGECVLETGDLAVCGSYWVHACRSALPGTKCLSLNFLPRVLGRRRPWPKQDLGSVKRFVLKQQHEGEIAQIRKDMEEIGEELSHTDAFSSEYIVSRLFDISWIASKKLYVAKKSREAGSGHDESVRQMLFVRDVIKYVETLYNTPLRLGETARHFGMSQASLSRLFMRETGKSFSEFIRHKRVDYASHLLRENDRNNTQIAYISGFESLSTFNRTFKTLTGLTPSQFKKTKRT